MQKIYAPLRAKSFITQNLYAENSSDLICLCSSDEEALNIYEELKFILPGKDIYYLPPWDSLPYDRSSPSNKIMAERAKIFTDIAAQYGTFILVTTVTAILNKIPLAQEFQNSQIKLYVGKEINRDWLVNFLLHNSFNRTDVATDIGEFALRGEIIDIVLTNGQAIRINFEWNKIKQIRKFEIDSQITTNSIDNIELYTASELKINDITIANFKKNFVSFFGLLNTDSLVYDNIINKIKIGATEFLLPLFYAATTDIFAYLKYPKIIVDDLVFRALHEYQAQIKDFYEARQQFKMGDNIYFALPPSELYLTTAQLETIFETHSCFFIDGNASTDKQYNHAFEIVPNFFIESTINQQTAIDLLLEYVKQRPDKQTIICCYSASSVERLHNILLNLNINHQLIDNLQSANHNINIAKNIRISGSYETSRYIFISEQELFGDRTIKAQTSKKRLKNILFEADSLRQGELVVHKEHGVGQYHGIETLQITGQPHDCLKLMYANNDKLYIPVENIDLIKRYGSDEGELDRLGSVAWQQRKAKLKNRISELAAKLLKTTATRSQLTVEPINITANLDLFVAKFPYAETADQTKAISEIQHDLESGRLMDRLICGDVGFGKTEVAMRAAFMVVADKYNNSATKPSKQVAVIVPTTILARQHFANFQQRFAGFDIKIKQLSRLVSNSEIKLIKNQLANGEIDIIIGTHALLADNIKFANLSLMIIDEEHHFGVKQKEKLKNFTQQLHILSLSATPIPRTLQMSLFGLRDLSLIAIPPIDRLSVRTSVIAYDQVILRDALLREKFRGGRSFYVSPRIADLANIATRLATMVPELTYKIAHGGMSPNDIDHIMNEFYDGNFDILLSTTIIESGLDVPAANTIIIDQAENLGLSQLYQLRGRVGRGKIRGFAYLTVNPRRLPTKESLKRLNIMQTVDSLGAGFSVASHDMDMRGFGNLVGDEQSGHIKEVGIELYQDMLNEEIAALSEPTNTIQHDYAPVINLGIAVFIPEHYISDVSLRIGLYRRIAALSTDDEIGQFKYEILDRFGDIPLELQNLLAVLHIKFLCRKFNIEKLDVGPKGIIIKFRDDKTDQECAEQTSALILSYVTKNIRIAKLKPDGKLIILKETNSDNILKTIELIFHEFVELRK